jgi:nitrite transporter NirC
MSTSVDEAAELAAAKARAARNLPNYLISSALAGAYVGVAVVLLATTAGPLAAAGASGTKLVSGCVFGIALTLVVFAGAELFTGNNMIMTIGWLRGSATPLQALAVNVVSLVGNFAGSVAFAAMVYWSGVLSTGSKPGKPAPGEAMINGIVHTKNAASDGQLFWRGVLCNMLVCLALWMAARTTSDSAKLIVLFWGLLAFIAAGYDHSIANMTIFSLAIFQGAADWGDLGHNLLWTIPGNVVGGAILVGLPYLYVQGRSQPATVEEKLEELEGGPWRRHRRASAEPAVGT